MADLTDITLDDIRFSVEPGDWLPVETLRTMYHPNNSQVRSEAEMAAIMRSIEGDGFTAEMIIVNRWNGKIVSGHGRTEACWLMGYRDKLPVIYRDYESEIEHRLAMLRWNRARGHQDTRLEQAELVFLLQYYSREDIATTLAYTGDELDSFVPDITQQTTLDDLIAEFGQPAERDFWPFLAVRISPEAMMLYESFRDQLPGYDDTWKIDQIFRAVDTSALLGGVDV